MTPERKVLLIEFLLGALVVGIGVSRFGFSRRWWTVPVSVAFAAVVATFQYYTERGVFDNRIGEVLAAVAVVGVPTAVVIALRVANSPLADGLGFALFVGTGVGILSYRLLYGLVRPVPESRLARVR